MIISDESHCANSQDERKPQRVEHSEDVFKDSMLAKMEDKLMSEHFGLSNEEVRVLREIFEFCDTDGSGFISHEELVPLLNTLGLPPNTRLQKGALQQCLDDVGPEELALRSLIVVVLEYHKAVAHAVVDEFCATSGGTGIRVEKLVVAFYQVGHFMNKDEVMTLLTEVGMDQSASMVDAGILAKMLKLHSSKNILEWAKGCGFAVRDIETFRFYFDKYCTSENKHHIPLDSVMSFLQDLNYAPTDREGKAALLSSLSRMHHDTSESLRFDDALFLLRHLENHKKKLNLAEEVDTIKSIGLDKESVEIIRTVFHQHAVAGKARITNQQIKVVFGKLSLVKSHNQRGVLSNILREYGDDDAELSFAEFLLVLNRLDKSDAF